jgi:acyl transferase domain-containing protein
MVLRMALQVPTQLESWPDDTGIRRASVNNFGYGGSNAHVIMEDYASYVASSFGNGSTATDSQHNNRLANGHTNGHTNGVSTNTKSRVFILSARDQLATESMLENLKSYLLSAQPKDEDNFLDSLAYTLGQRRTIFPWISALPAQNVSGLVNALGSAKSKPVRTPERPRLGFVFTGQGAQWWAMGRELIGAYPTFKASLIESERYLKELGAPWSLLGMFSSRLLHTYSCNFHEVSFCAY